jgi:Uma2 family endonuclease
MIRSVTAISPGHGMSPEQYLALELEAGCKHEYWSGEVFAMAGASRRHNLLVSNLVHLLVGALRERPCDVYPSDMRVSAAAADIFTYPDVSVVCGEPNFADQANDTLLNPVVIIEVLSDSTEAYDRGKKSGVGQGGRGSPDVKKFEHYRNIASVQHYLLVAQSKPLVEIYTRQADGTWSLSDRRLADQVVLPAVGCELAVADIYRRVLDPDGG